MTQQNTDISQDSLSHVADAEALSALMDNEASPLEIRRLVRRISEKPDLQDTWKRYQLVQSALQQTMHVRPSVDLLANIQSTLADEPVPGRQLSGAGRFWKLAGQSAIAASVAMLAVVGVGSIQVASQGENTSANVASAVNAEMPVLAGEYQPSALERTVRLDPAARTRLQQAVYQFSSSPNNTGIPASLILELQADTSSDAGMSDTNVELPR